MLKILFVGNQKLTKIIVITSLLAQVLVEAIIQVLESRKIQKIYIKVGISILLIEMFDVAGIQLYNYRCAAPKIKQIIADGFCR